MPITAGKHYDAIIIGAGQAGPPLADRLCRAGMRVAIIERKLFGGTCVNTGCTPTKTLVASAYAAKLIRHSTDYGIILDGVPLIDMRRVKARADRVSENARVGVETWMRGLEGCSVIQGHARFESPGSVRVGNDLLSAPRIFLNVGGRAVVPDFPGVDDIRYLTNTSILELNHVPDHLIVIGGSYIGLEFAQMYRRFGAAVTVIEKEGRLIAREDEAVSRAVRAILEGEGIIVRTDAECIRFAPHENGVLVGLNCSSGAPEVVGSHVLLAVGRRPNTDDLALERAGVTTNGRGYINVDDGLATNVPGIWAMGDCNGRGAFTHTAYNDFEIIAANLLDGEKRKVSDRVTGYALYIDPPLGRVGMTLVQARATGKPLLVGCLPMKRVSRAIEKGETQGFMFAVVDATSEKILGAAILGTSGDEAIHSVLGVMSLDAPYTALLRTVPIHPTVSELLPTLLATLKPEVGMKNQHMDDALEEALRESFPASDPLSSMQFE